MMARRGANKTIANEMLAVEASLDEEVGGAEPEELAVAAADRVEDTTAEVGERLALAVPSSTVK